ncbi:MAG TPA: APC family permease [Pyrinomonadaceae bacterium]|nr:APC family permease [Pyrinomonadaceae bacterium]
MTDEKLVRGIGRWDLTAIVINTIIGAGIFGLPSKVQAQIGSYSLFAFIACAITIAFIVLCHAEVATRFSSTGGAYLYAKEAFGRTFAFEVGWVYWIVRMTTFAANCNLFVTYLGFFYPAASDPYVRVAIIAVVTIGLSAVNILGVKQSSAMTNVFTFGKLIPLFLFIAVGLFFVSPSNFNFESVPAYASFSTAVLLLIYAFVGFEVALIPAGEVEEPQRNYPFALFIALAVVAFVYILVQVVCVGTLPGLATSERPLADAANAFMGPIGAAVIVVGALISILGNLNVGLLGASRITYAMGEGGDMPRAVAATHERFRTPWVSIIMNGLIIFVLTVQASFLTAVAIATITRLLVYATTCASLLVFRRRTDMPPARFLAPFGAAAAILSLVLIAWLLTNVDFAKEGIPIIIAAAAGLVLYGLFRLVSKRNTASPSESL